MHKMRISIVDDDEDECLVLKRALHLWGHEVVSAPDGIEALEILQKEPINFVISDWMMPRMDELNLCNKIRNGNFNRYIYTILLTANNQKNQLIIGNGGRSGRFHRKTVRQGRIKSEDKGRGKDFAA